MTDRSDAESEDGTAGEIDFGSTPSVSPEELAHRLRSGDDLSILDVRNRDEFEEWRLEGAGVEAVQIPHAKFIQA